MRPTDLQLEGGAAEIAASCEIRALTASPPRLAQNPKNPQVYDQQVSIIKVILGIEQADRMYKNILLRWAHVFIVFLRFCVLCFAFLRFVVFFAFFLSRFWTRKYVMSTCIQLY
jgi:hypothetical protein